LRAFRAGAGNFWGCIYMGVSSFFVSSALFGYHFAKGRLVSV
jgi:hypothetical protein